MLAMAFVSAVCTMAPLYSEDPAELSRKGVEFSDKKMYNEAAKEFQKAVSIYNSASARAYHNLGWVYELKGDYPQAIVNYEEAIRRNPKQLPSYERAGYLYYRTGNYEKAVEAGEFVVKTDPKNTEVIQWLPDAYKMMLQKQQEMMLAKQKEEEMRKREEERRRAQAREAAEKEEEQKPSRYVYATLDGMVRTGYFFDGRDYKYVTTPGMIIDAPWNLYINVTPALDWEFDLTTGTPYLGAIMPAVAAQIEKVQGIYHLGGYFLGLGCLITHYADDFAFVNEFSLQKNNYRRTDFKAGLVFGFRQDKAVMRFSVYPRFLPYDGTHSSGKTLDTDYYEFNLNYTVDKFLSYYSRLFASEYFFFDHTNRRSNYFGVYGFSFGVSLGQYNTLTNEKNVTITLEFTERFYMLDINNDEPYKAFNGQGWFGASTATWFKGGPFSGFYTSGHELSLKAEEPVGAHFFLYQKLLFEMTGSKGDHNEVALQLGAGGVF